MGDTDVKSCVKTHVAGGYEKMSNMTRKDADIESAVQTQFQSRMENCVNDGDAMPTDNDKKAKVKTCKTKIAAMRSMKRSAHNITDALVRGMASAYKAIFNITGSKTGCGPIC